MHHNVTFLSGMIVQNHLSLKMFASTLFNCCTVHVEYVLNMFAHGSACSNCLVKTEVFPLLHQSESICEQIQTNQSINNNNNLSLLLSMLVPVCSCGHFSLRIIGKATHRFQFANIVWAFLFGPSPSSLFQRSSSALCLCSVIQCPTFRESGC